MFLKFDPRCFDMPSASRYVGANMIRMLGPKVFARPELVVTRSKHIFRKLVPSIWTCCQLVCTSGATLFRKLVPILFPSLELVGTWANILNNMGTSASVHVGERHVQEFGPIFFDVTFSDW